ncbi:MAG TPA: hypothetical protein VE444_05290 [Gaiellaceae bacterium]|nr:hypothetical protein [Gaiellaceae bacterium]
MIADDDRLELPRGVRVVDGALDDTVRDVRVPLNVSGLAAVHAGSIAAIADGATALSDVPRERALQDARVFVHELNALQLLNVRARGGLVALAWRWACSAFVLVRHRTVERWPPRRCALPDGRRASVRAAAAALPSGVGGSAVVLAVAIAAGLPARTAVTAAFAIALGVAVHEGGHAMLLGGVPAYVARRGPRVAVVHRRLSRRREARIALGGAVAGNAYALAVAVAAWLLFAPLLAGAVAALVPHAFALTVVTSDGRRSCAA